MGSPAPRVTDFLKSELALKRSSSLIGVIIISTTVSLLLSGCAPQASDTSEEEAVAQAAAEIADRVTGYLAAIQDADVAAAADYWAEDARMIGPGMDLDRQGVLEGMEAAFGASTRVRVLRRETIEMFVHGNAAYEIAQAEEVFVTSDATPADTMRNNMFVRWERGSDGKWRFSRAVLGPQGALTQ